MILVNNQFYSQVINGIITLALFLFFNLNSQAQLAPNLNEYKGVNTYIYRLSEQDVLKIHLKGKTKNPLVYLHTLVDSVATDKIEEYNFKTGYYFLVSTENNNLRIREKIVQTLAPQLLHNGKDFQLLLYDAQGAKITNAEVQLDGKKILFNNELNSYIWKGKLKEGVLKVHYKDEFLFRKIERSGPEKDFRYYINQTLVDPFEKIFKDKKFKKKVEGYLITSKPIYRIGDTLKLKGVIVKGNKFYTKKLSLYLQYGQNYYDKKSKLADITPDKGGNYLFQFKLGDTLKIDKAYKLVLSNKRLSMENTFLLQDYRLEYCSFDASIDKGTYSGKDSIHLTLAAKDILGNPLYGGKAHIQLFCKNIEVMHDIAEYIPFKVYDSIVELSTGKLNEVVLPTTRFPLFSGTFLIRVRFTDANNQAEFKELTFRYENPIEYFKTELKDSLITINHFKNGEVIGSEGKLILRNDKYTFERHVTFPYTYKSDQYWVPKEVKIKERTYLVQAPTFVNPDFVVKSENNLISVQSINRSKIKFWYQLYRKNKLISSGYDTVFLFTSTEIDKNYTLKIGYFLNGEYLKISKSFPEKTNNYGIETNAPSYIAPGDTVNFKIKITDSRNRPVKNMNITAGAVDAKFTVRHFPNFNKDQSEFPVKDKDVIAIDNDRKYLTTNVTNEFLKSIRLDTALYYKFTHPSKKGFYNYSESIDSTTEFAPHVYSKGEKYWVYYILVDDKPVYFSYNNTDLMGYSFDRSSTEYFYPFSIKSTPGFHKVSIRTFDRLIELDSVYLEKGKKLDFSVDFSLKKQSNYKESKRKFFLTKQEAEKLKVNLIAIRNWDRKLTVVSNGFSDISFITGTYIASFNNAPITIKKDSKIDTIQIDSVNFIDIVEGANLRSHRDGYEKIKANYSLTGYNVTNLNQSIGDRISDVYNPPKQITSSSAGKTFINIYDYFLGDKTLFERNGTLFLNNYSLSPWISYTLYNKKDSSRYFEENLPIRYDVKPGNYFVIAKMDSFYLIKDSILIKENTLSVIDITTFLPIKDVSYLNYLTQKLIYKPLENVGLEQQRLDSYTSGNYASNYSNGNPPNSSIYYKDRNRNLFRSRYGRNYRFNNRYRYYSIGGGLMLSQWDYNNNWFQKKNHLSLYGFASRRINPRTTFEISLQYLHANAHYSNILYKTRQFLISPFVYLDLFQHRGKYQRRPDIVPFIKTGFSGFMNFGTYSKSGGLKLKNPSTAFFQPMLPLGLGFRYKFSIQFDLKFSALRNFNLLGSKFGTNNSLGNFNQFETSLSYIIPSSVICPKFRDGGVKEKNYPTPIRNSKIDEKSLSLNEDKDYTIELKPDESASPTNIKIRSNLNDLGYWQPALTTNNKGIVEYKAIFPEDITLWKNYLVGLGKNGKKFTNVRFIPSMLPLSLKLNVPRFLVLGDEFTAYGNLINFTDRINKSVHYSIQGGSTLQHIDSVMSKLLTIPALIKVQSTDSMNVIGKAFSKEIGADGESIKIPVVYQGVLEARGNSIMITSDTTFVITADSIIKGEITINNSGLDELLKDIEQLKKYPYACMEQTASKLKGLLLLKSIYEKQNKLFTEDEEIKKLLLKLERGQKPDGSWGWWPTTETDLYVSSYITSILAKADKVGYASASLEKAKKYLDRHRTDHVLSNEVAIALSELSIPVDTTTLKVISKSVGWKSDFERIQRIRILQLNKMNYSIEELLSMKKYSKTGGMYWGTKDYNWTSNITRVTLMAYSILRDHKGYEEEKKKIIQFFYEAKENGYWRNTMEVASAVELILNDLKENVSEKPEITINKNKVEVPYNASITPNTSYTVTCATRRPIFISYYTTHWNKTPVKSGNNFKIKTQFIKNDVEVESLKAGETYQIKVTVEALAKATYLMIEVPLPAGCLHANSNLNTWNDTYQENFKEKTNFYVSTLHPGTYTFNVPVKAAYPGTYTMNPAKVSLMYFPSLYGQEAVKKIKIH